MSVMSNVDLLSILSLILALLSAFASVLMYQANVIHDRRRDTLTAFNTLQTEVFDNLNKYMPKEIQEISLNPFSNEYKEISGYIARLEHFCVGVNEQIYDFETVYKLAHGYLDSKTILNRIEPIISRKNRKEGVDYYSNIHKVLHEMKRYKERNIFERIRKMIIYN